MTLKKQKLLSKTFFLLLFSFYLTIHSFAQVELSHAGTNFYVAFGRNGNVTSPTPLNLELLLRITSLTDTEVTISFRDRSVSNVVLQVSAGEIVDYHLSPEQMMACYTPNPDDLKFANDKSINVTSDEPITLVAVSTTNASSEAALVFSVENLGTDYIVWGMTPYDATNYSGFILVATEDRTSISIPSLGVTNYSMHRGQVLYYHNLSALGGTRITSDKPIACFQNETKIKLPDNGGQGNYTFEQLPPVNQWGHTFILPTNVRWPSTGEPDNPSFDGGAFARIYPKENSTRVQVTYSNGTSENFIINGSSPQNITINSNAHLAAQACYITADKPIGVYTYEQPRFSNEMGHPGLAWLPPLEQSTHKVLVSPLDLNGSLDYLRVYHYVNIIVPTSTAAMTTVSIDEGEPISLMDLPLSTFSWRVHDIGGSGYDFGRYYFGYSYPQPPYNILLNTHALFDNPEGIIVLAYGQGSYTDYFYTAGSAHRDLEMSFTVNGWYHNEIDGSTLCGPDFDLKIKTRLVRSPDNTYPRWYFNGIEDVSKQGLGFDASYLKTLPVGINTIKAEFKEDATNIIFERSATFMVSAPPSISAISLSPLIAGESITNITLPTPIVSGDDITDQGWRIETGAGSNAYIPLSLPYMVSLSDNGKKIYYFAENVCGTTTSNIEILKVTIPFQIWNWADLAYLNVLMGNYWGGSSTTCDWVVKYGMKAVLMQNLGSPDGTYGDGTDCPYADDERKYGYYGYENILEKTTPTYATTTSDLLVGESATPLGRFAWHATEGWIPIGRTMYPFVGEFEGNNFEISGLWINRTQAYQGLFGEMGYDPSSIARLGVNVDAKGIRGEGIVGGLVASAHKLVEITDCYVTGGDIKGKDTEGTCVVGGLAGEIDNSKITNCYATNDIYGDYTADYITDYARGMLGGLVGGMYYGSLISGCYATGNVNASEPNEIACSLYGGGLVGALLNYGGIEDSYATGDITVLSTFTHENYIGGLAGTIAGNYASETLSISNCYAIGTITTGANGGAVGGLAGNIETTNGRLSISNSYAFNPRISTIASANTGRIVGINVNEKATLTNNHANKDMIVEMDGDIVEITNGALNNKNGLNVACSQVNQDAGDTHYTTNGNNWDFGADATATWTFNYEYGNTAKNYLVTPITDLPILAAFTKTAFPEAEQPPHLCKTHKPFQIWNWADLAYLNVLMDEYWAAFKVGCSCDPFALYPPLTPEEEAAGYAAAAKKPDWAKIYGMKAVLMQNLGSPDGTYGDGTDCPYTDGERKYGYYGYENILEKTTPTYAATGSDLLVGESAIPLGKFAWHPTEGWIPIGRSMAELESNPFIGEFEGNNFEISGLWIDREQWAGLFGNIRYTRISRLGVNIDAKGIISGSFVGGLVSSGGTLKITDCYVTGGDIKGKYDYSVVGGLAGIVAACEITNCYATNDIYGNTGSGGALGGLVGMLTAASLVSNCYATGNVNAGVLNETSGWYSSGGLVGILSGCIIEDSYATGDITAYSTFTGNNSFGGLVGEVGMLSTPSSSISNCYATGTITTVENGNYRVGGLVGSMTDIVRTLNISNSYAFNPKISIAGSGDNTGRIIGGVMNGNVILSNNHAFKNMIVKIDGNAVEITDGALDNKNGLNVAGINVVQWAGDTYYTANVVGNTNNWDFTTTWTFDYDYNNASSAWKVKEETNLPILAAFTKTAFPEAEQPPVLVFEPEPFQIWNWADMAYLNVLMDEYWAAFQVGCSCNPTPMYRTPEEMAAGLAAAAKTDWAKIYGMKAVMMQNLVKPGDEDDNSDGEHGGLTRDVSAPLSYDAARKLGSYGYQNWDGTGTFIDQIYTNPALKVGGNDLIHLTTMAVSPSGDDCWNTKGWVPIGKCYSSGPSERKTFFGVFDGQNFEISGVWINRKPKIGAEGVGVFGYVGANELGLNAEMTTITNLGVNVDEKGIMGIDFVGGFVGIIWRTEITNCYVTGGDIDGSHHIGGFAGNTMFSTLRNCYATNKIVNLYNTSWGGSRGGLVGTTDLSSLISGCYATGDIINIIGYTDSGGLTGSLCTGSRVENSYATGNIIVNDPDNTEICWLGGLVGLIERDDPDEPAFITNCYATGDVIAKTSGEEYVGGLVGRTFNNTNIELNISNSYALNMKISSVGSNVGRIMGEVESNTTLTDNYALSCMLINNDLILDSHPQAVVNGMHGKNIDLAAATSEATFKAVPYANDWDWTTVWDFVTPPGEDVQVAEGTNLPVLRAFGSSLPIFANTVQSPKADCYMISFTVNGEEYYKMIGKGYCDVSTFEFEALYSPTKPAYITWTFDGKVILTGDEELIVIDIFDSGLHTISMTVPSGLSEITLTTHFYVGEGYLIWTPEKEFNTGDGQFNWNSPLNWTPNVVPSACLNVLIRGNSLYYPKLEEGIGGVCKNIYFTQGAELGRPDLLTYEKAYVQYNFGLKEYVQDKGEPPFGEDFLQSDETTTDRMQFSATVSANPLARERWYMLSSPLRKVVTGDLGFGGYPLTFLMKFGPVFKDRQYEVGQWTTPYNRMTEFVSTNAAGKFIPTGGFAFYMYGWGNPDGNNGCSEAGSFDANDLIYLPASRAGKDYGLKGTNGILELPFFTDSTALYAHRTQVYNSPVANDSRFFYIYDGVKGTESPNKLSGISEFVARENYSGNYRFAPENDSSGNGDWTFQNPIYHPGDGLGESDEFLVGNPYMSSIDMLEFLNDNSTTLEPQFRIWNGTRFVSYGILDDEIVPTDPPSDDATNPGYVAPLQGFFLKTADNYNGAGAAAKFDVTKISKVRPMFSPSNLRSAAETKEENILRIKSDNGLAESYTLIGYREGASNAFAHGKDVNKLFSPLGYVPEIYSLAGETPADINFISGNAVIPLGIKTENEGEIQLTFTGMDNYSKASKIELLDALENSTVDITDMSSYTYTFNNTETGIQDGRFYLRITSSVTDLSDISDSYDLTVYGNSNGVYVFSSPSDPVQQITVYDLQGRKVYENNTNAGYYPLPGISPQLLIVKVVTKNTAKTVKLGMK